jgi:alpha-1,2-mannosyltransferase
VSRGPVPYSLLLSALILTALTIGAAFAFKAAGKMPDFEVYWRAGARAMAAEPLYREEDGHYQFKYLPAFAMLAIPAALLPLTVAKGIWFTISVALVAALLALSLQLLAVMHKPPWLLITITLVAMAKFYGHELVLGQVNLLFAVVVVLAVLAGERQRGVEAGLLMTLAVIIKPYAVIFLPWLAAQRAVTALAVAGLTLAAALLLPALAYGIPGTVALHHDWWRTVTESTAPNLLNADNVSLAGMYTKWFGASTTAATLTLVTALALLGVVGIAFLARRRVSVPAGLEAAMLLTCIPLLSPQGWDYVFLLSTPAVMYLVNGDRELPSPLRVLTWVALAIIAFTIYDVIGRRAYGTFMALSGVTVCYLILIGAMLTLRLRRVA